MHAKSMQPDKIIEESSDEDQVKQTHVVVPDDLTLIGKRPVKSKSDGSLSLNYLGRVKQSSKKNA
jgi:hypothetical protein